MLYGFLGPNGAGKTTTIRMMLSLIRPSAGQAYVLDESVFSSAAAAQGALRRVGAVIEEPAFWRWLTGRKNLECFANAGGPAPDRRARVARIDEVLATVGLRSAADKRVKAYSQGMRQRLGLALALLGDPEVLVLDEPTNGLDPQGMREFRMLLRRLADAGTTIFVSSHLLGEVEAMCDHVGVLAQGKLVAQGPPSELRKRTDTVRVEVDDRLRASEVLADLTGVKVRDEQVRASSHSTMYTLALTGDATPAQVNGRLVAAGVKVGALIPEQASLEDVFLTLVEGADVPR